MDINRYTPKLKLSTDKLLSLDNLTPEDIFEILHLARQIKQRDRMKERVYPLKDKVVAIILDSSNSRLRIPFELTVTQLGGHTLYLSPKDRDFMMGMTYRDVSALLAQYGVHCLVTKAETAELRNELSRYSPLPVVNCMESSDNPSEVLAALFTVWEKKGKLENLKLTVVGNGKNLNPAAVNAYAKAGFSVSLLCPEGMEPDEDGLQTIIAEVPLAELANFTTFIRQTTQGRGWFTTEFARYETLPEMLVPAVVEQAKKLGNLDESADD